MDNPKLRSALCKKEKMIRFFKLINDDILPRYVIYKFCFMYTYISIYSQSYDPETITYRSLKDKAEDYQNVKNIFLQQNIYFKEWIKGDPANEAFKLI